MSELHQGRTLRTQALSQGGPHLLPIACPTGLTEADLTPAFDSRFSSEQMALAWHPSHGSDGEPRGRSVDLDEKEDADQERPGMPCLGKHAADHVLMGPNSTHPLGLINIPHSLQWGIIL